MAGKCHSWYVKAAPKFHSIITILTLTILIVNILIWLSELTYLPTNRLFTTRFQPRSLGRWTGGLL